MSEKKILVIYHSADFDGIFCREIARKFLGDAAEYIGWDHGDPKMAFPTTYETVYVLDLSPDCFVSLPHISNLIWIDHHKSSIEKFAPEIPGYRIDGVAACRLVWQWFNQRENPSFDVQLLELPSKQMYVDRLVHEPFAVTLAGEYDIWDKRDPKAEEFQFGLRSKDLAPYDWHQLLDTTVEHPDAFQASNSAIYTNVLLQNGALLQRYQRQTDESIVKHRSCLVEFAGLRFLALNTARCNSLTFAALDVPETDHDALMGFFWDGQQWKVSLYHARHRTDSDLSTIAAARGGGGHRGACGWHTKTMLPWLIPAAHAIPAGLGEAEKQSLAENS